jgi:thiol-disulfide isomerase/thioredoxin
MKRFLKYITLICLLAVATCTAHYTHTLYADGPADITFLEPQQEYASFNELIQHPDLRNKVIYVDFWHTGCKPCLIEFNHLPQLKSHFKADQGIAFLYLGKDRSVPGEKYRWKKMVLSKNITGYHYFISDAQFDSFWEETVQDTSINKAFPHHLVINQKGKVVHHNAPGPQHQDLVQLLKAEL